MDRGAWQSTDHDVAKSWPRLSDSHTYIHTLEWVAIPSSGGLPTQRSNPHLLCLLYLLAGSFPLSHLGSLAEGLCA